MTLRTFFRWTARQSGIFNRFDLSKNPKRSERIDADELSKASSTGSEILDNHMTNYVKESNLGMRNSVFGVPQGLRLPISHICIDSFNHSPSKSVKDMKKVCIKCAAAFKALGPVRVLPCS